LEQLRSAVYKLQQEVAQLRAAGTAQGTGADATYASAATDTRSTGAGTAAGAKSRTTARSAAPRGMRSMAALEVFKQQPDEATLNDVLNRWPSILQRVKDRKITVHAWLIDGEPVAATKNELLLAFKSAMHRETTEKPANRELIEQTIAESFGRPLKFLTVMKNEWTELQASPVEGRTERATPEVLQLTPEDEGKNEQDWIKEAIHLFGEDLVTIKED
jgi:DNA polymerase-3 subunit gamma/tau